MIHRLSSLASHFDNRPRTLSLEWPQVVAWLSEHREAECTPENCIGKDCPSKNGPSWSPASYDPGARRCIENAREISIFVLDLDHVQDADIGPIATALESRGLAYVAHSSHNDEPGDRAIRVVIPLSRPVDGGATWYAFWRAAVAFLGVPADKTCKDPSRLYYLPSHKRGCAYLATSHPGGPLDVDAVLAAAPPEQPAESLTLAPARDPHDFPPASPELLAHARRRLQEHGPAVQGQGGDQHTYRAGAILAFDLALAADEAWELLREWNATCQPPWHEGDLLTKLRNGATYAQGERGAERDRVAAAAAVDAVARLLPGVAVSAPPVAKPAQVIPEGMDPWFYQMQYARWQVQQALTADATPKERAPLFYAARELHRRSFEAPAYIVDRLITAGGTAIIGGEPKTFKTWLAMEIAIGVATGTPVLGEYATGAAACVAYYFAEDLDRQVRNRDRALCEPRGLDPALCEKLFVRPRGEFIDITNDEDLAWVIASCRVLPEPPVMVILEPLRDIQAGEEDSSDAMRNVMRRLRLIGELLSEKREDGSWLRRCTVVACHHMAKAGQDTRGRRGGQRLRGSSALHGSVDSGLYLSDHRGDGESTFANTIESEIKGARGAGVIDVELTITDDARGEAVRAAWKIDRASAVDRAVAKAAAGDDEADAIVLDRIRNLPPMGRTLLAQVPGLAKVRAFNAIKRLESKRVIEEREDVATAKKALFVRAEPLEPVAPAEAKDPTMAGFAK